MKMGTTALLGATAIVAGVLVPHSALATTARIAQASPVAQVEEFKQAERRQPPVPPAGIDGFFNRCPEGSSPVPFDMPIYDDEGLFVVGYETVWFCIPDDLEPAG